MRDLSDEELKSAIEHRDILLDIKTTLNSEAGKRFIKYLFKHLEVGEVPPLGLTGDILMDKLGFLRAGNSIFKLVAEADFVTTGNIIADVEREKHAEIYAEFIDG